AGFVILQRRGKGLAARTLLLLQKGRNSQSRRRTPRKTARLRLKNSPERDNARGRALQQTYLGLRTKCSCGVCLREPDAAFFSIFISQWRSNSLCRYDRF